MAYAKEHMGEEFSFADCYDEGTLTDVVAVTKGYGWQGVIRRFGGKLQSHKNSKKRRQHGNMGDFGTGYVRKTIRQGGQTGYHQRTEYNKRILRISNPDEHPITPAGGFALRKRRLGLRPRQGQPAWPREAPHSLPRRQPCREHADP
ncbi:MAG: hypothetical protein CM15mP79_1810 [Methanobacteriota archaeon]|nr:MAG: hypothetical protein CM15mP79_1810 [Euryarchaeota archaeon]